jgi:hypothetical protein
MVATGSFRGGIVVPNTLYGAWTGEIYSVNQSGELTLFSTLSGTDMPFFGRNNAATPDVAVRTDVGVYLINTSGGTLDAYPDSDVGSPSCLCGYLGYLWYGYGDGTLQVSKFNSTAVNTLDQALTITNPDGILNIFGYNGQIYAMGENTVEIWGEPINATGFPLTRQGFNITPGLMAAHAVAGWEPEWGYPPIYVGSDGTVRQIQGYQAVKISTSDIDRDIQGVNFNSVSSINALVYNTGGHAFWQLNLPSKTWVYHVNEGTWHERKSQYLTKSRLVRSVPFTERWLTGDTQGANLFVMDVDEHTEGGAELTATMESGPVKQFPHRQRVARCDFDITPGTGVTTGTDPVQTDPQMQIEVSYDGGRTWPHSWNRKIGQQAESMRRVFVTSPGITGDEGARWRWSISDPVHVGFQGADMAPTVLSK